MKKKILVLMSLVLLTFVGSTYAQTSCYQQLANYKSYYATQLKANATLLTMIKSTNTYLVCLRGWVRYENEFSDCNYGYYLYKGQWNILYKYGFVSQPIVDYN